MEIKVPEVGESIHEAEVGKWHKQDGDQVKKGDLVCELETDKITLEVNAEVSGTLSIKVQQGETVEVGTVIGSIEEDGTEAGEGGGESDKAGRAEPKEPSPGEKKKETGERDKKGQEKADKEKEEKKAREQKKEEKETGPPREFPAEKKPGEDETEKAETKKKSQQNVSAGEVEGRTTRERMSRIRQRIAERLMKARQETAMLTTFNEADLSRVIDLRNKRGEQFQKKHGVALGFMSFFVKASVEALKEFPAVNARIEGEDIVYHHFFDIGIAISTEKGLVVPVVRNAEHLHFAEIEQAIVDFADKARNNQLELADLEGGTFSITNGGVFGSMLSTPLLNPPQSAILGMHAIQQRPVVRDDQVVIRPMMYLALSYDHRIIDGREAVRFLKKVVEFIEEPEEMLLEM